MEGLEGGVGFRGRLLRGKVLKMMGDGVWVGGLLIVLGVVFVLWFRNKARGEVRKLA